MGDHLFPSPWQRHDALRAEVGAQAGAADTARETSTALYPLIVRQGMDKYKVLEEWRAGSFGAICIVKEAVGDGRRFAVKKVECIDEHEANLALKEAMVLLNLQHPNICAYKEFFITWDNTISSLFLSLVMDVSDQGDLGGIVRLKRQLVKKMDETVIQMLLGQAIDVLVYIHKQKVLHRNLKPSNILLKDEASFLLSDFVVETLAADEMKLKIRMDDECKLWMAPEALQFSYSEKSDVWSLGCVLLDMMTCSITTDAEVAALLQEIRLDPVCLENVLKTLVGKVGYSADLCQVLLQMLQIHPVQRATAIELMDVPYVKECLILVGSPLSGVKKTLPPGVSDELYEGGIEKALEFMQIYTDFEDAQISALRHLSWYIADQDGWLCIEEIIRLVVQAMKLHSDSLDIQLEGIWILRDLVSQALAHGLNEECFISNELITTLVRGMRSFLPNTGLLSQICSLMMMLSANEVAAELLGKAGVLQDTLKIMESSLENRELCLSCCGLLWSMAMTESHTRREWLVYAVPVIFNLVLKHLHDGQLVESACCSLWILCLKGCVVEEQTESISWALLESLHAHPQRPVLVKNACLALASLLRTSELAAFRVLVPVSGKNGIALIKEIYHLHSDDPEIVENMCLLFSEMAHYGDTRPEMLSQNMGPFMREIKVKFASTEEIVTLAESTLSKLET